MQLKMRVSVCNEVRIDFEPISYAVYCLYSIGNEFDIIELIRIGRWNHVITNLFFFRIIGSPDRKLG